MARLDARAGQAPILVALSGGGDSVALLHLLAEHIGAPRLIAAVVDHALREGSAADAARAQGFAESLGVAAHVLKLAWPNGLRRAQADARQARYRALCAHARAHGANVIALGHTSDDQAETVLMRAARGSTWRGLAGMGAFAPAPAWPEGRALAVARPLLNVRRQALRDYLRQRGASWLEDPANANTDFARVRARAALAAMGDGLSARLAGLADQCAAHAAAQDAAAAALIEAAARFADADIVIDLTRWRGDGAVRTRALAVLIAAAAGAAREPGADQVAALEASIAAPGFKASTLGGALIRLSGPRLTLTRDAGALKGRADGAPAPAEALLPAGREVVWDGRVALTMAEPGWAVAPAEAALQRDGMRLPLSAAAPRWLLADRAAHALYRA